MALLDSFRARKTLQAGGATYDYVSLRDAEANGLKGISRLPVSLKVLLENLLRFEDGRSVTRADIEAIVGFHRDGIAPVWHEFFDQWNREVQDGRRRLLPFEPRAIPPFMPRWIEPQEVIQEVDGLP